MSRLNFQPKPAHVHDFTKHIAIPDRPATLEAQQADMAIREEKHLPHYDKGIRYILARQCACGQTNAYDLTYHLPKQQRSTELHDKNNKNGSHHDEEARQL